MRRIRSVAVLPFTDAPGADAGNSGRIIAGTIGASALGISEWRVVDQSHLQELVGKIDLRRASQEDLLRIGRSLGVDAVIVGNVSQYEIGSIPFLFFFVFDKNVYRVSYSMRMIDVQSGEICWAGSASGTSLKSLEDSALLATEKLFVNIKSINFSGAPDVDRGYVQSSPKLPAVKVEDGGVGIALIIGISNYDILGPLSNCREDAEAIRKVLTERGYAPERVVLLTDTATAPENRATYTCIERRIKQICEFSNPDDSLVIYFAGHGTSIDGEGYLIPQDGDEKNRGTSISLTKLQQQMQNSKAGRKLLVLDACHSGSATRGVTGITPSLKTSGVHVMASCAENELSHPDSDSKHGVFTRYLLEGVEGAADTDKNGSVTQKELFAYIQKNLMEWGLKTGKTQRPQMLSPTTEDVVISKVSDRLLSQ